MTDAREHLANARNYIAKGEDFYRKAAEEIVAAMKEDTTLSYRGVGEAVGRSSDWCEGLVSWVTIPADRRPPSPWAADSKARTTRAARQVFREADPGQIAELLDTPEVRAKVSKALDTHYTEQAKQTAARHREREVERKGSEEEHAAYEERQRVVELVDVVRGAASALRFAAGQAKALRLDEAGAGGADELRASLDEILGFASMLREFLGGREITDGDIAALIGGES